MTVGGVTGTAAVAVLLLQPALKLSSPMIAVVASEIENVGLILISDSDLEVDYSE